MLTAEQLDAIEEIRQLKARYCRFVDLKNWAELAEVFAPDAVFDRTTGRSVQDPWTGEWRPPLPPQEQLVHGREAIIEMITTAVAEVLTIHHCHMPEIEITGPDSATGIWAMSDELRTPAGRLIVAGRGHYLETYVRIGDRWMIRTCQLTRLSLIRPDDQAQTS